RAATERERVVEGGEARVVGREPAAIPDDVRGAALVRVGGDRFLVVEVWRLRVDDDRRRLAPGEPTVDRGAGEDRRRRLVGTDREADLIRDPVGSDAYPRVGRAVVRPAVRGRAARARAEMGCRRLGPARAAGERDDGGQPVRAAVRPAVLLEYADEVGRVGRIRGDKRLDLRVDVIRRVVE